MEYEKSLVVRVGAVVSMKTAATLQRNGETRMSTESNGTGVKAKDGVNAMTAPPVIIDLGKKRRKQVKDLRKGKEGRLMRNVNEAIQALVEQGTVSTDAQPIIVVIRERRRKSGWLGA